MGVGKWINNHTIVPLTRMATEYVGPAIKKITGYKSAADKEAEAIARTKRAMEAERVAAEAESKGNELLADQTRRRAVEFEVEKSKGMGPVARTAVGLATGAAIVGSPGIEGYVAGRWGDPQAGSVGQFVTIPLSAFADILEFRGDSTANFITDFYRGGYVLGNAARYDKATPEERERKKLLPSWERAASLAKTEPHPATRTSLTEYGVAREADAVKIPVAKSAAAASAATADAGQKNADAQNKTADANLKLATAQSDLQQDFAKSLQAVQVAGTASAASAPARTEEQRRTHQSFSID